MSKKKVVVGMSGGVDSSVAAWLLLEQGYEVVGVTMQVWPDVRPDVRPDEYPDDQPDGGCCGLSAVEDARRVADCLGIPYYVLNFKRVFQRYVIEDFIRAYTRGLTPNPCIACNRYVKWESLLNKAMQLGADYIATGHYARVVRHPRTNRLCLRVSATQEKDQTYALYSLTQEQLARTLTPAGDYTKTEIRALAERLELPVAHKPDSQEICFVPDGDYAAFIRDNTDAPMEPGDFLSADGQVLGRHKGLIHYTVGQRKGLGSFGKRMYVKRLDRDRNAVVLAEENQIFERELLAGDVRWMAFEPFAGEEALLGKIRYGSQAADCQIRLEGTNIRCRFRTAQRAVTPGQAAVFYDGEYLACGGTILPTDAGIKPS
ncbi:MAG: tRNA 2-thiouridine(34) synthase MnmA [Clostridiales bacterium]|nr:tRNA 2-thiouridine(34) synthase MnmA [Clostridiales bacterium]